MVVEVSETYVGGYKKGAKGRPTDKTIVFGMVERGGEGEVVVKVIPNVTAKTLHGEIEAHVEKGTEIHADGYGPL